ncbi:MAG: hypothetical protein J5382_09615 [Bacteroidales bacterium]|jgi:hypothetical protein|nr:hypothetical protein [Bacteroidales bacterium]
MKTFIFSLPARLKSFNEKLDVKGALCGKSWEVFNDEGVKQLFIFNTDGTLLITLNGKVMTSSWKYIPANSSILITTDNETIMFLPAFYDEVIFALQQDGIERYLFMIDEKNKSIFPEITLKALTSYFEEKEWKIIEAEMREKRLTDPVYLAEMRVKRERIEAEKEARIQAEVEKEKDAVRQFIEENKELLLKKYKATNKRNIIGLIVSIACLAVFTFIAIKVSGQASMVLGLVLLFVVYYAFKIDKIEQFIKDEYEASKNEQLKYLDKSDIKQLYEEL